MKIKIVVVGKNKDQYVSLAEAEYLKRLQAYLPIETLVVPALKNYKNMKPGKIISREGDKILRFLPKNAYLIALDETGKQFSSISFAKNLKKIMNYQSKPIFFIIGGAYGISKQVKRKCAQIISFSKLTFTHQMIRIILLEQIYRAMTILKGKKYHH